MAAVTTNVSNNNSTTPLGISQGGTNASSFSSGMVYDNGTSLTSFAVSNTNCIVVGTSSAPTTSLTVAPVYSSSASTAITAANNSGYITTAGTLATVTLPTTFSVGNQFAVQGQGAGKWTLAAGAATTIQYLGSATSSGGSLSAANRYDSIRVIGIVANTTWGVMFATSSGLVVA